MVIIVVGIVIAGLVGLGLAFVLDRRVEEQDFAQFPGAEPPEGRHVRA